MKPIISESFLSFLEKGGSKISRHLYKCFTHTYSNLLSDSEINYLTFRDDGSISYLPKGSEHVWTEDGKWSRKNRQNGKPSKIIKKIMTPRLLKSFNDKDFEGFHNNYKASGNTSYEFSLRGNEEIPDVYDMPYYESGTLENSCMRSHGYYLDIYKNCSELKILCLINIDTGILHGRALVWDTGEFIFMDRIYTSHDYMYDMFLQYAEDNGWWRKEEYNSYSNKTSLISPDGSYISKKMTIYTPTDFSYYPYIDTFSYGGDGYLSNVDVDCYTYDCTDGGRCESDPYEGQTYCECDDEYYDDDVVVYINCGDREGQYCHIDNAVCIDGYYFHEYDKRVIWIDGIAYDSEGDDIVYSDYLEDYALRDDVIYVEDRYDYYPKDMVVYVGSGSNYYLIDDTEYDEERGIYKLKGEEVC